MLHFSCFGFYGFLGGFSLSFSDFFLLKLCIEAVVMFCSLEISFIFLSKQYYMYVGKNEVTFLFWYNEVYFV